MGLTILEMMNKASETQIQIEKRTGDWRYQIEQLTPIVAQVTEWQTKFFKVFGRPQVRIYRLGGTNYAVQEMPTGIIRNRMEVLDNPVVPAVITQYMATKLEMDPLQVKYRATMHTDENEFLRLELPKEKEIQIPQCEPDYPLYKIDISIPRADLQKETLFILNERLAKAEL